MSSRSKNLDNPAIKDCVLKIKTILDGARGEGKRSLSRAELTENYFQFYGSLLGDAIARCGFLDSTEFLRKFGFDATDRRISVETAVAFDAAVENQVSLMQRTPGSKGSLLTKSYAKHRIQRQSSFTASCSASSPAVFLNNNLTKRRPPSPLPGTIKKYKASDFVELGIKLLTQCKITTYEETKEMIPNFDQLIGVYESDDESL
uniref:Uncharacterized protein n=1 Tax=Panagrolaimus sp. JU765 TaxID=591449 RepID=A0AC34Q8F6_9BILA